MGTTERRTLAVVGEDNELRVMLTEAQRTNRAPKIAEKVRARMKEQDVSVSELARRTGLSRYVVTNSVMVYRKGPDTDKRVKDVAKVSVALGWPGKFLPGLLDGSIDLSEDPDTLEAEPQQEAQPRSRPRQGKPRDRAKVSDGRKPADDGESAEPRPKGGPIARLVRRLEALEAKVEDLTAPIAAQEGSASRQPGRRAS